MVTQGEWWSRKGNGCRAKGMVVTQGEWWSRKGNGGSAKRMVATSGECCHAVNKTTHLETG